MIEQRQSELVALFDGLSSWEERYKKIILLGKDLAPLEEKYKEDKFKVKGCLSQVWLTAEFKDGGIQYYADSDALIVKGIVALLVNAFSGATPDEVLAANLDFLDKIGIRQHLSMNRSNGLTAMIKQVKLFAMAFKAQGMS